MVYVLRLLNYIILFLSFGVGVSLYAPAWAASAPARGHILATTGLFEQVPAETDIPQQDVNAQIPVHLTADEVTYDDDRQLVTASGRVEFTYGARRMVADTVTYDLSAEHVQAKGNVELYDENGDVHRSEQFDMDQDMRAGYVMALRSTLADGSRFEAARGQRIAGRYIEMDHARYTPCLPCKAHPERAPTWELRADKVTHDMTDKKITYRNAWMEIGGVPVAYTPYFSHPDGTVKQKSGFLAPSFKLDSNNGAMLGTHYYWAMAPDRDATMTTEVYTKQAPRLAAEYRQQFDRAALKLQASTTYSKRRTQNNDNDETLYVDEKWRGHIDAEGRMDINDLWRGGFHLNLASDDQYFRQYDVTSEDVLESQLYLERFEGRDYASFRAIGFQDLRTSDRRAEQPAIFPEAKGIFYGDPGDFLGGRWKLDTSLLGLQRRGTGADMGRFSSTLSWQDRYVTPFGLLTTLDASARADAYQAIDRADVADNVDKNRTRFIPTIHAVSSYPLIKRMDHADIVLEPIGALTVVRKQSNDSGIPNEDSQDVQLEVSNLFEASRFPGIDRVEDLTRATYGLRSSITTDDGKNAEAFLGQSYRFEKDQTLFPVNSGLAEQTSDVVGYIKLDDAQHIQLDYGFQLSSDIFSSVRHEVGGTFTLKPIKLDAMYLYAKEIEGIGIDQSREQARARLTYDVNDEWSVYSGLTYDFGVDSGLRKSEAGITYNGQCIDLTLAAERKLVNEGTGESGSEMMIRIGFKNLGTFQTSGISLSGSGESNSENN